MENVKILTDGKTADPFCCPREDLNVRISRVLAFCFSQQRGGKLAHEFHTFNKKIVFLVFCRASNIPSNGAGFRVIDAMQCPQTKGKERIHQNEMSYPL